MVYTIYDGPRLLADGRYFYAYAAWTDARNQQANRGAVVIQTPDGRTLHCDLANDHLSQFTEDHFRTNEEGEIEAYVWPIAEQVAAAIDRYLARAAARGERGNKLLPIHTHRLEAVEEHLAKRAGRLK